MRLGRAAFLFSVLSTITGFGAIEEENTSHASFSAPGHMLFANQKDPNDQTAKPRSNFVHEMAPLVQYDKYSFGVNFTNKLNHDGRSEDATPFYLEKVRGRATWDDVDVQLGDSYQELGKGIALSLFDNPAFGLNTTLQGAAVRVHPANWEVSAFAGRVNAMQNPVAVNPFANPAVGRTVLMAGGAASIKVASNTKLGTHYVHTRQKPDGEERYDRDWTTVGLSTSIEGLAEEIDIYVESNLMQPRQLTPYKIPLEKAWATYASVAWSPVPWQVQLEVKDYRDFYYQFQRPPLLEDDTVATLNSEKVTAGRLYGQYIDLESRTTVYSSMLVGEDRIDNGKLYHAIAGSKFVGAGQTAYEVKAGYRWVPTISDMVHASAKAKVRTRKGQYVEGTASIIHRNQSLNTPNPTKDNRDVFSLGYTFNEYFNAALGYEYVPTAPVGVSQHYFNVAGTYRVGSVGAKAFIGQTSGGVQCIGGVCRQVPPFTGAYVEGSYTF